MNALTRLLFVAALFVALSVSSSAQWPDHKAARARLPDGTVDLNGPAPKTADGKPQDLSGTYRNVGRPAEPPPEAVSLDEKPLATFRDIGAGFKDGLPLRPWAKELLR